MGVGQVEKNTGEEGPEITENKPDTKWAVRFSSKWIEKSNGSLIMEFGVKSLKIIGKELNGQDGRWSGREDT